MAKEPIWKYPAFTCLVAVMNLVGLFIAQFAVQLVAGVSQVFYYSVVKQDRVDATLALLWACLAMGFLCGACLRRSISALAVPVGWIITGWLSYLAFRSEHYLDREPSWPILLVPLVVVPALAAVSAWRGSNWAAQKTRKDILWLVVTLVAVAALVACNRTLFALVPDKLRWRIWNCPL